MIEIASQLNPFCLSSFLAFRYVADERAEWVPGVRPRWPRSASEHRVEVSDAGQILDALRAHVARVATGPHIGLLLSGGMDSAILAALLPRGTPAYTVRFDAEASVDESVAAAASARRCGLEHHVVTVSWDDCQSYMDELMRRKRSPLHPVEVGLFLVASAAAADGVRTLIVGNGADSNFGGLDRLLSQDWTLDEFIGRYTFLEPSAALQDPVSMWPIFAEYARAGRFDTDGFLKEVHGRGIIQAFNNSIEAAGCTSLEPYESLRLGVPLDLARIRRGEPKYLLREVYHQLYPKIAVNEKIAFARPMDRWMSSWEGPRREEFRTDIDMDRLTGEQKWLLYCLERFLNLLEAE
jgi:asparagine synthetase B (glutamine-hydrolysing)